MQIDLDDNDAYAAPPMPAGGLATGGSFGEDALSTPAAAGQYLQRINPNVIVIGGFVIGGVFALNTLVAGLGQANPNNQMLQANQVTAEANGTALTATTEALKTVASQRPGCIAIVCTFPAEALPVQQQQQQPIDQYPDYYEPPPIQSVTATTLSATTATDLDPSDPRNTPDYWRAWWRQDPSYVQRYITYCQQQNGSGWQTSDCQALSRTLN